MEADKLQSIHLLRRNRLREIIITPIQFLLIVSGFVSLHEADLSFRQKIKKVLMQDVFQRIPVILLMCDKEVIEV